LVLSLAALGLTFAPDRDYGAIWYQSPKLFSYPGGRLPIGGIVSGVAALIIARVLANVPYAE